MKTNYNHRKITLLMKNEIYKERDDFEQRMTKKSPLMLSFEGLLDKRRKGITVSVYFQRLTFTPFKFLKNILVLVF